MARCETPLGSPAALNNAEKSAQRDSRAGSCIHGRKQNAAHLPKIQGMRFNGLHQALAHTA